MRDVEKWQLKRLEEIGDIYSGSTPSTTKSSFWNGDIIWVTPNDLSQLNTPYLTTSGKKITLEGLKSCSSHILPSGSIILSSRAPIGYIAISTVEFCTNQGCKSFNLKEQYNSEFVYYNLNFNINKIKTLGEGTTFAEISKTALRKVEILFLENKEEQEKIAAVLSTIDRAIAQTEAIIAKQQRIKTGLMQDLLTKGIDENGNIRSEATHEFKDSAMGRIPIKWGVESLDNCVMANAPICYGILMPGFYYNAGVPVIKVKDIIGGSIIQDDLLLTDPKIDRQYQRSRLLEKDLLITIRGTTGRVALVPSELRGANITQDTARVRLQDDYSKDFFYFLLQSFPVQYQVSLHTLGQAVKGINIAELKKIHISLPPLEEQEMIAQKLNQITIYLRCVQEDLIKLKQQKTGLMQDLLTGKVRVTNLLKQKAATN